ncbi:hypothetical protein EV700_1043 [Fluviicoccus keumensis]|uniref:Uncharacterized protein n=1 Tax=Fluviicoccus keumensis TaxID=1435465 RepID=A0A4Q7ZD23_9GAMM|nr:hypothetical protein [Fluviicoccus keumensis]RZU48071.1 hypothetical protein EV700_1043 [Fluviicoccus keumensis]
MSRPSLRLVLLLTVVIAALLLMRWAVREPALPPVAVVTPVTAVAAEPASTPVAPPIAAPDPDARPAFVSDMEWQVLQAVAAQHAEPKAELARLVSNLEFSKRRAAWEALVKPEEADKRRQLAASLLAEIPDRVRGQALDAAQAKALQQQLLADVVDDPAERTRRLDAEQQRLPHLLDSGPAARSSP